MSRICLVWDELVRDIEVWTYGELRERVTAATGLLRQVMKLEDDEQQV